MTAYGDTKQTELQAEGTGAGLTENRLFRVSFTSELDPIVINTIHTWIIHVEDINGQPVTGAEISIDGGMPEHDHGLPTRPQVNRNSERGSYSAEGMKFHMNGWWTVVMTITNGDISDHIAFDLNL